MGVNDLADHYHDKSLSKIRIVSDLNRQGHVLIHHGSNQLAGHPLSSEFEDVETNEQCSIKLLFCKGNFDFIVFYRVLTKVE